MQTIQYIGVSPFLAGGGPKHDVNLDSLSFCSQMCTLVQQENIYCRLALQLAEQNESF